MLGRGIQIERRTQKHIVSWKGTVKQTIKRMKPNQKRVTQEKECEKCRLPLFLRSL